MFVMSRVCRVYCSSTMVCEVGIKYAPGATGVVGRNMVVLPPGNTGLPPPIDVPDRFLTLADAWVTPLPLGTAVPLPPGRAFNTTVVPP